MKEDRLEICRKIFKPDPGPLLREVPGGYLMGYTGRKVTHCYLDPFLGTVYICEGDREVRED